MAEDTPNTPQENELQTPEALQALKEKLRAEVLNEAKAENRKRGLWVTMGALLGAGASIGISFYWNTIGAWFNILVGTAVIGILLVGLVLYFLLFFKSTILAKIFGVGKASYEDIFSTLYKPAQQLVQNNLPASTYEQKVNPYLEAIEKGSRQLIAYQSFLRTRRMLFGLFISLVIGLGGIIGTVLILRQNKLLEVQNQLVEGQRRSSLIFMMSNIMDKVDEEIKVQKDRMREQLFTERSLRLLKDPDTLLFEIQIIEATLDTFKWRISKNLIGRIAALSQAFKPHQFLDQDGLSKALSPERGQLLLAITKSNLDHWTYQQIYKDSNFRDADLRNTSLKGAVLMGADLARTDFKGADLELANLSYANLRISNLEDANLVGATLLKTDLTASRLVNSDFTGANLTEAILEFAAVRGADFLSKDYIQGQLVEVTRLDLLSAPKEVQEAYSRDANLSKADLSSIDFNGLHEISLEQLLTVNFLYRTKNLPVSYRDSIFARNPEILFDPVQYSN